MGFDNMDWVEHLTPPLTTMNIPTLDMGRAGIKRLLELIEAREKNIEEKPIKIILPVKLIERASVIDAKKL
jgi:DNA-binding LacI/PurR family transcriptional regulator